MKKAFWILIGLLITSIAVNVWLWFREPKVETKIETKTDTIWRDTVIEKPVPTESKETGETIYVKVPVVKQSGTVPNCLNDSTVGALAQTQGTVPDCLTVSLPVEQKRYDDSLYTAWVSGFRPALDSIRLHLPEVQTTTVITNTIIRPNPRISIGIQTGGGYGIINKQFDLFVGVGGQINLWSK